jgi:hypothetical protein
MVQPARSADRRRARPGRDRPARRPGCARACAAVWLLLGWLALAATGPAGAGVRTEAETVQDELQKTDEVIARAREVLRESSVTAAHEHLKSAIELQANARRQFEVGRSSAKPERFFARAVELTLKARQEALRAMDLARVEVRTQDSVRQGIDRATERAAEVGRLVRASGDAQAAQIFDQAIDHLNRARRAERERDYVQAARLAMLAANLLDRAAELVPNRAADAAAVAASLDRTAALLAEVESALADSGRRLDEVPLLQEARQLLLQARVSLRDGDVRAARQRSLAARQRALRLLADLAQDRGGQPRLDEAIDELQALYAELGPEIEAAGGQAEKEMLDEGRRMLRRARELLQGDKPRAALQHLLVAEGLLKRAAHSVGL